MLMVLYTYGGCTLLVVLRLGWHMAFRLDSYDWRYGEVWPNFWLTLLLWPLALIKPHILISPKLTSANEFVDLPARYRELDHLRSHLPPCGNKVRVAQPQPDGSTSSFIFERDAVAQALATDSPKCADEPSCQRHDILRWVSQPDRLADTVTDVPAAWWEFMSLAAALLHQGYGVACCGRCGKETPAAELVPEPLRLVHYSFHRWCCACGNELLKVETVHVYR